MNANYVVNDELATKDQLSAAELALAEKHDLLKKFCLEKAEEMGIDMIMFTTEDSEDEMASMGLTGHIPTLIEMIRRSLANPQVQKSLLSEYIDVMKKVTDAYPEEEHDAIAEEAGHGIASLTINLEKYNK